MKPDFIKLLELTWGQGESGEYVYIPELRRALEDKCKVVYGEDSQNEELGMAWSESKSHFDTHTAFIFGVSEVVKDPCKHEPIEEQTGITVFKQQTVEKLPIGPVLYKPVCKHCGSKLKPVAWEVEG